MRRPDRLTKLNEETWNSRARNYDLDFRYNRLAQRKLISRLDLKNDPFLLDIACGTGWGLRYAARLAEGHGRFYGIDLASRMLEEAKKKSAGYENIHLCRANADTLPFENDFFDYAICTNAFHHFSRPDRVVKEAHRVLKPGGSFYILDPTGDSFLLRFFDRIQRKAEPAHVKMYSTKEYRSFFEEAGFVYTRGGRVLPAAKIHMGEKAR